MTLVLGLDLSIAETGVCLPSGQMDSLTTKPGTGDARLVLIRRALVYYVKATKPDVAVIEEVPPSMRGGTITLVRLGLVHGVAREVLASHAVPFAYIGGSKLKKYATGGGGSDKQAMIDAAVDVGAAPRNDNEADAFWCRSAGVHHYDRRPAGPKQGLSGELLAGLKWPRLA